MSRVSFVSIMSLAVPNLPTLSWILVRQTVNWGLLSRMTADVTLSKPVKNAKCTERNQVSNPEKFFSDLKFGRRGRFRWPRRSGESGWSRRSGEVRGVLVVR